MAANDFPRCPFRRTVKATQICGLAQDIIEAPIAAESFAVSQATCQQCGQFFEPSLDEPNPIVASIADNAIDPIVAKRDWLLQFQRTQLHPENVRPDGIALRNKVVPGNLHLTGDSECGSTGCFYVTRQRGVGTGNSPHNTNWPFAFAALETHHCPSGVLLDDYVEERFGHHMGSAPYREPWVGIFHHPMDDCGMGRRQLMLDSIFQTPSWRASEEHLKGAITFSQHNANLLAERISAPVIAIKCPYPEAIRTWDAETFLTNRKKFLIQLGWYQQNTRAINGLAKTRLRKLRLLPIQQRRDVQLQERIEADSAIDGLRPIERVMFQKDEQIASFGENVIFQEVLGDSVNAALLNCIAASTPLITNRHPSVVEYLGEHYPLYFEDIGEVPELCTDEKILGAHRYLQQLDKSWMSTDSFISALTRVIAEWKDQV